MGQRLMTEEQDAYLRNIAKGRNAEMIARMMNEKFGTSFTTNQIHCYKSNHHIRSGHKIPNEKARLFTDEQIHFIRSNYIGKGNQELTDMLNSEFNTGYTAKQVKAYKHRYHLDSGITGYFEKGRVPANKGKKLSPEIYAKAYPTMFHKGNVPHNTVPIGTEVVDADGYIMVKVNDTPNVKKKENWKFKHRLIWEEHYGPIPDDHIIIFKDGDTNNLNIDNLMCITRSENLLLNNRGLKSDDPKLTETGVNVVRLIKLINEKEREAKGSEEANKDENNHIE